jgi:hypothetical protein
LLSTTKQPRTTSSITTSDNSIEQPKHRTSHQEFARTGSTSPAFLRSLRVAPPSSSWVLANPVAQVIAPRLTHDHNQADLYLRQGGPMTACTNLCLPIASEMPLLICCNTSRMYVVVASR